MNIIVYLFSNIGKTIMRSGTLYEEAVISLHTSNPYHFLYFLQEHHFLFTPAVSETQ